jgi:hypothetical protein
MELTDQAAYHAGKHAFHNARAHGFGVLCGLRVERFVHPQMPTTKTTFLRVTRGAALDPCGREVLVGVDQCIDLKAWYSKHGNRPTMAAAKASGTQAIYVAVRYRDCPSDPVSAPRDSCACETTGTEFGRVREAFELGLFSAEEAKDVLAGPVFPDRDALLGALGGALGGNAGGDVDALDAAIDELLSKCCPPSPEKEWLALARFKVELTTNSSGTVELTDIVPDPDNAPPERHSLLPTWALQFLALRTAADTGQLAAGPRWQPLSLSGSSGGAVKLLVPITLANFPMAESTFDPATVKLHKLDTSSFKWVSVSFASTSYDGATSTVRMELSSIEEDVPHRLVIDPQFETPLVDRAMRPVTPLRFAQDFRAVKDGAGPALRLAPVL